MTFMPARRSWTSGLFISFIAGLLSVGLSLATAVPATATATTTTTTTTTTEPLFIGWSGLLPPLPAAYSPAQAQQCADGAPECADATIAQMQSRFAPLAASCDHNAVFALTYLRTTEEYRRTAAQPGFFADVAYVNTEDAVFAAYYFHAYDAWLAGDGGGVSPAWQIAFDAAAGRQLAGAGNILLGMNAHVNRDLPLVLASLGLVTAGGQSRKADHDKVNVMLNRVIDPLLREAADRFDPSIDDIASPLGLSYTVLMQILVAWRETAWRNAERLVNAPTAEARAQIQREIETTAAATATVLRTAYAVPRLLPLGQNRDTYCAARSARS
ncbi:hypothetical protein CcI49_36265 [Frankia sp. CcI49]|nr:hypothetical protein CcI49_36265 [Frankia sp. CcI49]